MMGASENTPNSFRGGAVMALNDKAVAAAKPREKAYKMTDGGGLYLEVLPSGAKSWRLKYRFGGKEKRLAFGLYPVVSLKDAREHAHEARKLLVNGADPGEVKKAAKVAAAEAVKPVETFEKVLRELCEAKSKRASEKHVNDYLRSMELHVLPTFGKCDIASITAMEVIGLAKKVEDSGRYQAHRMVARIGEVMDFAVATGRREQNPVTKMTHSTIAPHAHENNPAISISDLPAFLKDLGGYRGFPITIMMLRFVMLTACRTGEARDLIWDWVDLEKQIITIPPSGYKTGRRAINSGKAASAKPHLIPISDQVAELLRDAQELTGNQGERYVFPAYRNWAGKASENALSSALANIGGGTWKGKQSGHGFRRLARTAWADSGLWSFEAMEKQLAHTIGGATVTAYDKAERIEERARMMQWWADRVDICATGKVIPLRRSA